MRGGDGGKEVTLRLTCPDGDVRTMLCYVNLAKKKKRSEVAPVKKSEVARRVIHNLKTKRGRTENPAT